MIERTHSSRVEDRYAWLRRDAIFIVAQDNAAENLTQSGGTSQLEAHDSTAGCKPNMITDPSGCSSRAWRRGKRVTSSPSDDTTRTEPC